MERAFEPFGQSAIDREAGGRLKGADRQAGLRAGHAVGRTGGVAQPGEGVLDFDDPVPHFAILSPSCAPGGRRRFRPGRRAPLPRQALCTGEFVA